MRPRHSPADLQRPLQQAASHPWFEGLARLGYGAKGVVYFTIGLLAAQAAIGFGGKTTDTNGALETLVTQPFGRLLLAIVAIGLVGYVLLRAVQAILDPEHSGESLNAKRIAQRLGYAFSAIGYTGLAFTAVRLMVGARDNTASNGTQDWTARLLVQPFGQWLVGFAGLVVIGVGISYLYEAYKATFQHKFKLNQMSNTERRWTKRLGQFGTAARGFVFGIIGLFLVQAAIHFNASEAKGLGDALETLRQQPFGPWLLGLVALGFIAYSLYSLVAARYLKVT